jgi:hypothetical protein
MPLKFQGTFRALAPYLLCKKSGGGRHKMREIMGRRTQIATVLCMLAAGITALVGSAIAAPAEKYLHVNVEDPSRGGSVNVNVTLSMAERILPAINNHDLHDGKVSIHHTEMNGVDVRALLDAVRNSPDNEFVTVQGQGFGCPRGQGERKYPHSCDRQEEQGAEG